MPADGKYMWLVYWSEIVIIVQWPD